jgi:hypothetical protein
MRFLIGFSLILCSVCGIAVSTLGDTVVTSSMHLLNGIKITAALGIFSAFLFLSGLYLLTTD